MVSKTRNYLICVDLLPGMVEGGVVETFGGGDHKVNPLKESGEHFHFINLFNS